MMHFEVAMDPELYNAFAKACEAEGYSVDEAIKLLAEGWVGAHIDEAFHPEASADELLQMAIQRATKNWDQD